MESVERGLSFLAGAGRPVESTWANCITGRGVRERVTEALAAYQNDDGGFGRNLEVDIKAPDSQPFAARIAMLVLASIGTRPDEPILKRLERWLDANQDEDGCWRFSKGVYEHDLAPWFAHWTFPSLNPTLCVAAAAHRLGIGSDRLFARVAALTDRLAALDEVEQGGFYELLPYVEYFPWVDHPRRETYLVGLADRIVRIANKGSYEDAGHFFDHVGPASGELAGRVPHSLLSAQLDRLVGEQQPDGGWPTPYDPAWRPWATASAIAVLVDYGVSEGSKAANPNRPS